MARHGLIALLCAGILLGALSTPLCSPRTASAGPGDDRDGPVAAQLAVQTALQHGRELVVRGDYAAAVHQLEGHVIVPRVMGQALGAHPLLVIFALVAGAELYGIVGAVLSLPLLAMGREVAVFLPLVLITLWMGIYPNSFLDPMAPSIDKLIGDYNAALKLARTAALQ